MAADKTAKTTEEAAEDKRPVVLKVNHVSKSFRLPTEQASGLKQLIINWTKGIRGYKTQHVLKDISFEIRQGDFFGIVGRNGSGKSTLLKLISGIYVPDSGTIEVNGKLVSFIELGVGFNPELTGRQNVYLNGALLGFSTEEIDAMYDDIVQFAELEDFMDQKLKNYSSGMQVRLAFSVAIKAKGDILVLDEVLAVGDEAFQRKCDNFFTQIKKDPTKTVILVTHSMDSVKKYCTDAILIEDGVITVRGDKDEVANRYTLENTQRVQEKNRKNEDEKKEAKKQYPLGLNEKVPFLRVNAVSPTLRKSWETFKFDVEYEVHEPQEHFLALSLLDVKRGGITFDPGGRAVKLGKGDGHGIVHFEMPLKLFNTGDFKILAALRVPDPNDPKESLLLAYTNDDNCCFFSIRDPGNQGYALLNNEAMSITEIGRD